MRTLMVVYLTFRTVQCLLVLSFFDLRNVAVTGLVRGCDSRSECAKGGTSGSSLSEAGYGW